MDLKGPLSDTHLKLYPSKELIKFIQTIPTDVNIPKNIQKFVTSSKCNLEIKKTQNDLKEHLDKVAFSDIDIENLKKIKVKVAKSGEEPKQLDETNSTSANSDIENLKKIKVKVAKSGEEPKQLDETNSTSPNSENISESFKNDPDLSKSDKSEANDSGDTLSQNLFEVIQPEREGPFMIISDIYWLYAYLEQQRKMDKEIPYLHKLLEGTDIDTPRNTVLKRNPVLEARCVKLRAQQEAREYRKMTKGVDNVRIRFPDDSISYQLKQINRQLIAIGQFIISIFAGFLFGFKGVEWMIGELDFGFKLLLGVMCALIIALAEIYFLAKKLNEELNVPETVQLGGPPQFVDKKTYAFEPRTTKEPAIVNNKEHQD